MNMATFFAAPRRAASRRPAVILDTLGSLAAIAALAVSMAANVSEPDDDEKQRTAAGGATGSPMAYSQPRETMIGAYIGAPYTYASGVHVQNPGKNDFTVRDVTWDGKPFEDPIYYGARVAHWLGGGPFGAMIDFTHSKTIARLADEKEFTGVLRGATAPARSVLEKIFYKLEFSHGHNMLTMNGLMRLPGLGARFAPYAGLGGGVSLPHTEVHIAKENARTYEYQYAGLVGQALVGLEIRLPRFSVFVEYKFSLAPYAVPLSHRDSRATLFEDVWTQWRSWLAGERPPGGVLTTRLTSHQVISGIGVRIGRAP